MKQKLLKMMLLLCALIVGSGNAWATDPVTLASWTFTSESKPANKTDFKATGGSCTNSTFYLNGSGSTWNSTKGYAFTSVTDITITLKTTVALPAGTAISFSADMFYNKADNAPMTGFNLTASVNSGSYATTGLDVTSFSLSNSSATKTCVYTLQSDLAVDGTVAIKYTQTGKAGSGQGYFNNIAITYTPATPAGTTAAPTIEGNTPFLDNTTVTINNAASADGADIFYTLNGDDPTTTTSATCFAYSAPFQVSATTTVKAIAKKSTDTNASSVVNKTFTKVTPMTVSAALTAISALASNGTIADQCVSGVVCTAGSLSNGAITYYISADGTESSRLQVYKGKGLNNADFEAAGDIALGDEVVVFGTLKNFNGTTPEFDQGSYLLSKVRKPSPELAWSAASYTATYGGSISYPTLTNPNSVTVTYSSSDTNIATIDPSTGVITLKANGDTDITASFAGNATYRAQEVSYTLTVAGMKTAPGFSFANAEINMAYDEDYEGQTLTNPNSLTVTYESDDTDVADVDENTGVLVLYKAGTVTITANYDGDATYAAGSASYTLNVTKAAAGLAFASAGPFKVAPDAVFDVPAFTNPHSLTVEWSSTDEFVAVADADAAVIGSKLGTAVITASFDGNDRYNAAEVSYTIIVTNDIEVTWDLSTNSYDATPSETLIQWSNTNVTMKNERNGNSNTAVNNYIPTAQKSTRMYAKNKLTITPLNGFAIKSIVFTATTVGYANALAGSTWTNASATASTAAAPYTVTVTPENGNNAVSATLGGTTGFTSVVVSLTKVFEVKLNASGYATFAAPAPLDFSDDSEYSAWQITDVNSSTGVITFSQIDDAVAAGTGVLLKGTASATIGIPVATSGSDISITNQLVGITTATAVTANQYFGLKGNTFVPVNAGTVPAGKALLRYFAKEVKSFTFVFEDATGVRTIENVSAAEAEAIFNLAGQRIQKPQKGINIINGRKVVVK